MYDDVIDDAKSSPENENLNNFLERMNEFISIMNEKIYILENIENNFEPKPVSDVEGGKCAKEPEGYFQKMKNLLAKSQNTIDRLDSTTTFLNRIF